MKLKQKKCCNVELKIDAENEEEAIKRVKERYKNEESVLDYNDFVNLDFKNVLI